MQGRLLAAGCLVGIAVTHATELAHKLDHAPYVGVLFAVLIPASIGLAVLLVVGTAPRLVWSSAGVLALSVMTGYVWSRTVGLPQLGDHVGHWLEPMGAVSLVLESVLVTLAAARLDRWRTLRRAAAALAATLLVFAAGAAAQEAVEPSAGTAHTHAGHQHGSLPDLTHVDEAELAEGRALLRRVQVAAASRFATYDDARAAGFDRFHGRGWVRPLVFHMRHPGYAADERVLDPTRPESLVYWWPARGRPQLLAMMFRAPPNHAHTGTPSVLMWHQHENSRTGRRGATAMTHVWLTDDVRTAFANCLPVRALEHALPGFRYSEPRSAQAAESRRCRAG